MSYNLFLNSKRYHKNTPSFIQKFPQRKAAKLLPRTYSLLKWREQRKGSRIPMLPTNDSYQSSENLGRIHIGRIEYVNRCVLVI